MTVLALIMAPASSANAMLFATDHSNPPADLAAVWGVPTDASGKIEWTKSNGVDVQLIGTTVPANVMFPGDAPSFTFQVTNDNTQAVADDGFVEVMQYGLSSVGDDFFAYQAHKLALIEKIPVKISIPAKGFQNVVVAPHIPERFGGYALIMDMGRYGRHFAAGCIRTFAASPVREPYPVMSLDYRDDAFLQRIGVGAVRFSFSYVATTDPDFQKRLDDLRKTMQQMQAHNIAVTMFFEGGGHQALGRWAHYLNDKDEMINGGSVDTMWTPDYDPDFAREVKLICSEFGWPKGPLSAVYLYNEPWDGGGISGWLADIPRYREAYKAMASGVLAARKDAGVQVLVGGCDSSTNARDKLFSDGNEFLPIFDFVSEHYQGLDSEETTPIWRDRNEPAPYGRVRIWDTESWVANTDERVAPMLASWRAAGYDRLMGVDANNCVDQWNVKVRNADGTSTSYLAVHPSPTAASVGAATHFLGDRPFRRMLFTDGLPWVMIFGGLPTPDGRPGSDEDGTVVAAGDILAGKTTRFTSVKLSAAGGSMTIPASPDYSLYDFYGNPVRPQNGRLVIPLNHAGYYLRGNGHPGSFEKLIARLQTAEIRGYDPVEIIAHDMTAPIGSRPQIVLSVTNVGDRPVEGTMALTVGSLKLSAQSRALHLKGDATQQVSFEVLGGSESPDNTYPLNAVFTAKGGAQVTHIEKIHCNVIAKRTITVDGNLDDWVGVLPQPVASSDQMPSVEQKAWYPNSTFSPSLVSGFATGYLAYDDTYFYFAAKIADTTPDPGTLRFAKRMTDPHFDDRFFYPAVSYAHNDVSHEHPLAWPAGMRRYDYRRVPILPAGNGLVSFDNVQIAFNVIPEDDVALKGAYPYPPGTMPRYTPYKDTDYEYALNTVADQYGAGTEIWRLQVPGMPRQMFFPREPGTAFEGAVADGKLVTRREGNTRIVECAIPWSEMPYVKARLDKGETIKFTFRVNDNDGPGYELAHDRSVSQMDPNTFHCDWVSHWSNELEFGAGK